MKVINTDKAPAALGPYSQALESGNIVFVSGQIPLNPETGIIPETIEEQAEQAIRNAEAILKENGSRYPDTMLRSSSAPFKNGEQTNLLRGMIILP